MLRKEGLQTKLFKLSKLIWDPQRCGVDSTRHENSVCNPAVASGRMQKEISVVNTDWFSGKW